MKLKIKCKNIYTNTIIIDFYYRLLLILSFRLCYDLHLYN